MQQKAKSGKGLYKFFIYFVLCMLAITIVVPVAWVFMASVKENREFYGNPWTLPEGLYWQNFVDAWNKASMGEYMINSVIVTALSIILLLVIALPAAYCLARFKFKGQKLLNTAFMAGLFINVNYIVVPIFLMLRDGDVWLKKIFGEGFLLNNLFVLAVVYAATALPFTIYLLSGYFVSLPHDYEEADTGLLPATKYYYRVYALNGSIKSEKQGGIGEYTQSKFTVTFDANGGNCTTKGKSVIYNGTYGDLPTPTRFV